MKAFKKQVWKPGCMLNPVPAALVSCADKDGNSNILTIAWTGVANSEPPMVYISVRPERYSYRMIDETGEFVVNLTTEELTAATDYCGVTSGSKADKWKECHLTPAAASKVSAPLIAESPVNIECKVRQKLELGSHHMFLADVVAVDVADEFMDEKGRFDLDACKLIAYNHGEYWTLGKKLGSFGYTVRKTTQKSTQKKEAKTLPGGTSKETGTKSVWKSQVTVYKHKDGVKRHKEE